ncbi:MULTISPECIES: glycoside hydrolase family 65 protein [Carnobacterium]|uniref:glycoside hydrolase family 65 protein n=1 Tax=Carnobacterium TaxID=2747 RepID=UPI00289063FC|nr:MULTISPECIES: glycoside hydrolase family 65 protein [Carnobacterium]MDT1940190.1 glycoside hydrolase family 65 protein [Carnobacterium divergens]MDT1942628.1 glycoside hydrolase family 65 protein [Carnobacterium divergens]MDT1948434.1 glycoside hydrolase family 65 protein [Carnobacterium divergens]MDT1950915.1 glycoside hydrolase family 65 protein [Carnobacterium divergens]MDT1955745.1 glycoside hydrolase family 65 protein [Carnobacterium divergens]
MTIERLFDIDAWKVKTNTLDKENRRLQESLTSLGNGYMGMRGNFEERYTGDHHEGNYIAGVWYPDKTRVGWWKNGYPEYFGKVINSINIIAMDILIDGNAMDLFTDQIEDFLLELDMEKGVLRRSFIVSKNGKRIKFEFQRFLSLAVKELCSIQVIVTNLGEPAKVEIQSQLNGDVRNQDSNYDEMFWLPVEAASNRLVVETKPNDFGIEQFTVAATMSNTVEGLVKTTEKIEELTVSECFSGKLETNQKASLTKNIIVTTSRDYDQEAVLKAGEALMEENIVPHSFEELKTAHEKIWGDRWKLSDVEIGGDDAQQQGIRFNLFQLFSTYYGEDMRLNIGPKGFTGEKYGGATYWDTEAYAVPLYLALADPSVSKNLLKYRHEQLPGAYHNAKQQGLAGALYPMVTFTGIECHNEWEITFEEIHRNGAIAYAIYNYTNYTGDHSYVANEGMDVLVGISRFWADRVHFSTTKKQYMIHGVTGPNEYENNINNNWYTNKLATWTLAYTLEKLQTADEEAVNRTNVTKEEKQKWQDIIEKMYYPYDAERDVFVQHDTFLDKELMPVSQLAKTDLPINQNWSWDKILRSCFIKQADVLQGIYFFNNQFTKAEKQRNFDFYEPMTVHESSLSPSVHAILAAELEMSEKAVELYARTARLDLDNYNNDTEDGLHITSMTGSWLTIVEGFAGMRTFADTLSFKPFVPADWDYYRFHINYRGRLIFIEVNQTETSLTLISGEPLTLNLYDKVVELATKLTVPTYQV